MAFIENIITYFNEYGIGEMILKILLAVIAGAIVGAEREVHGRAAGLRTHILVSLGSALCAIIGSYLSVEMAKMGINSDAQRTGAQVISGISFLGAGTILIRKGKSHISGLTTAAGIWATAAIGLAVGFGLYVPAFFSAILAVVAFAMLTKLEYYMNRKRRTMTFYIEVNSVTAVKGTLYALKNDFRALEVQVTESRSGIGTNVGIEATIRMPHNVSVDRKIAKLENLQNVDFVTIV